MRIGLSLLLLRLCLLICRRRVRSTAHIRSFRRDNASDRRWVSDRCCAFRRLLADSGWRMIGTRTRRLHRAQVEWTEIEVNVELAETRWTAVCARMMHNESTGNGRRCHRRLIDILILSRRRRCRWTRSNRQAGAEGRIFTRVLARMSDGRLGAERWRIEERLWQLSHGERHLQWCFPLQCIAEELVELVARIFVDENDEIVFLLVLLLLQWRIILADGRLWWIAAAVVAGAEGHGCVLLAERVEATI